MRFVLFIAFIAFLGWALDNIVSPWLDLKVLERRARRQLEQQRQLREILEASCICDWFDHDTLIRDPDCKASDHGLIAWQNERLMSYLHANSPKMPYKFRGK